MSDPVSNAEIEDVLSSIRRLVSVDTRSGDTSSTPETEASSLWKERVPKAAPRQDIEDAQTPAEEEARLVLTPSFRVDSQDEDAQDETLHSEHAGDAHEADEAGDDVTDSDRLVLEPWQVTATVSAKADDSIQTHDHFVYSNDSYFGSDDALQPAAPSDKDRGAADGESHEEADADTATDQDDDAHFETEQPEATAHEVVDVARDAADDQDEFDVESLAVDTDASDSAHGVLEHDTADDADGTAYDGADEEPYDTMHDAPKESSALEARIAEVEAAVAARDDEWEPDGSSDDEYAGGETAPLPWEDAAEESESRTTHDDVTDAVVEPLYAEPTDEGATPIDTAVVYAAHASRDAPETEPQDRFAALQDDSGSGQGETWYEDDADAILDEDALRDLVSEIVRQELQGTLGERITRNVRKLVRREIHRAMMGQDFD